MGVFRRKQGETIKVQVGEGTSWTRAGLWGIAGLMVASSLGLVIAYSPGTEAPGGSWALCLFVLSPLFGFPVGWSFKSIAEALSDFRVSGMRRVIPLVVLLVGLLGVGSAQGITVAKPGIEATVTATIAPTRLPKDRTAPVTLALDGHVTHSDRTTCEGSCAHLRTIEVRLDRQVGVDTEGLPTCQVNDVKGYSPSQARRKCGRALIGSGTTTETVQFPEVAPFTVSTEQLFFNAGKSGAVLMYNYSSQYGSSAGRVGTIRHLKLRPNSGGPAAEVSFRFTFGKTWSYKGERHSYMNGSCVTGTLKNPITLELDSGEMSETVPQRCTKRSSQ